MATLEIRVSSTIGTVETRESSLETAIETRESKDDMFTIKKIQNCTNAWENENYWSLGMETI